MKFPAIFLSFVVPLFFAQANDVTNDWMSFYYLSPSPEKTVLQIKKSIEQGLLSDENSHPPVISFFSQLLKKNPSHLEKWMALFENIDESLKKIFLAAAWYSDTNEAQEYFKDNGLDNYLKRSPPNILELKINNPQILDMLWGYFFATGDSKPIHRIVSAFNLQIYSGAVEKYKDSQKTEKDKKEAYLDATFQAARWSLESNCRQHYRVLSICEELYSKGNLPKDQSLWLAVILAKVKPEQYQIDFGGSNMFKATTPNISSDQITTILEKKKKASQRLLDDYISWVKPYIREYPPRFKSPDHENKIRYSSKLIVEEINMLNMDEIENTEVLISLAQILAMGHNLDIDSAELGKLYFERALTIDPDNRKGNYLMGMFLSSTQKYGYDSIPYLEKALKLGEKDARYTLGLFFCRQGKKEKGLSYIKTYSKNNPNNEHVKMIINSIEDDTLKFLEK